jgi:DNA-binding PadR family transcriptional regulator
MRKRAQHAHPQPPLSPVVLHVLLALADGDKHGYAIIKEIRRRTGGEIEIGSSSLYATVRRLLEEGLLTETDDRPDPSLDDERRRYYRLTKLGREIAVREVKRLQSVILQARAKRLVTDRGAI